MTFLKFVSTVFWGLRPGQWLMLIGLSMIVVSNIARGGK